MTLPAEVRASRVLGTSGGVFTAVSAAPRSRSRRFPLERTFQTARLSATSLTSCFCGTSPPNSNVVNRREGKREWATDRTRERERGGSRSGKILNTRGTNLFTTDRLRPDHRCGEPEGSTRSRDGRSYNHFEDKTTSSKRSARRTSTAFFQAMQETPPPADPVRQCANSAPTRALRDLLSEPPPSFMFADPGKKFAYPGRPGLRASRPLDSCAPRVTAAYLKGIQLPAAEVATSCPSAVGDSTQGDRAHSSTLSRSSWLHAGAPDLVEQVVDATIRGFLADPRALLAGTDMVSARPAEPPPRPAPLRDHGRGRGLRGDAGAGAGGPVHGPARQGHGDDPARAAPTSGSPRTRRRTSTSRTPSRRRRSCACAACRASSAPDNLIVSVHEHPAAERAPRRAARLRARGLRGVEPALERPGARTSTDLKRAAAYILDGPLGGAPLRTVRGRRLPRDPRPPLQDHRHHHGGARRSRPRPSCSWTTATPQELQQTLRGRDQLRAREGRRPAPTRSEVAAEIRRVGCPTTTSAPRATSGRGRSRTYSGASRPASA